MWMKWHSPPGTSATICFGCFQSQALVRAWFPTLEWLRASEKKWEVSKKTQSLAYIQMCHARTLPLWFIPKGKKTETAHDIDIGGFPSATILHLFKNIYIHLFSLLFIYLFSKYLLSICYPCAMCWGYGEEPGRCGPCLHRSGKDRQKTNCQLLKIVWSAMGGKYRML